MSASVTGPTPGRRNHRWSLFAPHRAAVRRALALAAIAVAIIGLAVDTARTQAASPTIIVADIDGVIDPVMERYVSRILDKAKDDGANLIIFVIDTPGGQFATTRDIVGDILDSPVPVVTFVGPFGARAASAGTFISAAGGIAAMAPSTNIGAASPVGSQGEDLGDTLKRKATEDAAALLRSVADLRGRNSDALEKTVTSATAYSSQEALDLGVIDLIATDVGELIELLDGRTIATSGGDVTLVTAGPTIRNEGMSFVEIILSFLATPDVVFLFFSLGGLALVVELWSPGITGPGVVGVILLLLSFAGLGSLPFSWVGVVLLLFAIVMLIAEAHAPGFGIFGVAAAISLVLGGVMLAGFFGTTPLDAPPEKVSFWLLITVAGLTSVATIWIGVEIRKARGPGSYVSQLSTGVLVGKVGVVSLALSPVGEITLAGESWSARVDDDAAAAEIGTSVVVRKVDGLTLEVEIDPETGSEQGTG